jgi:small-conductance mechanosensitive channel
LRLPRRGYEHVTTGLRTQGNGSGTQPRPARLSRALVTGIAALVLLVAGNELKSWHLRSPEGRLLLILLPPLVFLCVAVVFVRAVSSEVEYISRRRGGKGVANTLRMLVTVVGYLVALVGALSLTNYPLTHLLLGASIVGVVVGIAAQQSLGNVFAGFVLLMARPFAVGNHIRVRSGALGGEFYGTVVSMSLTYVTISTGDGILKVPNSSVLSSAVGPCPRPTDGPQSSTGSAPSDRDRTFQR